LIPKSHRKNKTKTRQISLRLLIILKKITKRRTPMLKLRPIRKSKRAKRRVKTRKKVRRRKEMLKVKKRRMRVMKIHKIKSDIL